jgi:hypothetical protein
MYFFDPNIVVKVGHPGFRHTRPPVYRAAERYPKERAVQVVTCRPPQNAAPSPILFGLNELSRSADAQHAAAHAPLHASSPLPTGPILIDRQNASAELTPYKNREITRGPALCFRWLAEGAAALMAARSVKLGGDFQGVRGRHGQAASGKQEEDGANEASKG